MFTYRQIDEASNVLAHHLLAGGIEREDVCTVYSTRGVDLVIAVLGILKAGATFSVIGEPALSLPDIKHYNDDSQTLHTLLLAKRSTFASPSREVSSSSLQPASSFLLFANSSTQSCRSNARCLVSDFMTMVNSPPLKICLHRNKRSLRSRRASHSVLTRSARFHSLLAVPAYPKAFVAVISA